MVMKFSPITAPGAKVTSTSTSLSGPKSSRSTDPNRASSTMFQRWQKCSDGLKEQADRQSLFVPITHLRAYQVALHPARKLH